MSLLRAKEHLKKYGLEDRLMEFDVSSATVADAAKAIGCTEKEIVKTLSFLVNGKPILIAASGNAKIDNAKFKAEFHTKASMIPFDEVERLTGHAVGGVCPFGVEPEVTLYFDRSLMQLELLYPAGGTANSAVRLTLKELEAAANPEKWVDVCKIIQPEAAL